VHHLDTPMGTTVLAGDTEGRLDAIDAALARLEAGTYGTCNTCNEPIPYGRLIVMPEATHCVGC
jgi:RNA polymerase-binding transcription factor DksA